MPIDIDEDNLRAGVLGLVVAITEIVKDALKLQAVKRMEGGSLTEEEIERLGKALKELDTALNQIKEDQGITQTVYQVREGLDDLVDDVLDKILNPEKWREESKKHE